MVRFEETANAVSFLFSSIFLLIWYSKLKGDVIVKRFDKKIIFLWVIVLSYVISILVLLKSFKSSNATFINDSKEFVVFIFSFFLWEFINLAFDHYFFEETSEIGDSNSNELASMDTKMFNNKTGMLIVLVLGSLVSIFFN